MFTPFSQHNVNEEEEEEEYNSVSELLEYYNRMSTDEQFQCEWLHGREFDRYHLQSQHDEELWSYAVIESSSSKKNKVKSISVIL